MDTNLDILVRLIITVSVAQLVEHQIVALRVAGSSPVAHPLVKRQDVLPFPIKRSPSEATRLPCSFCK